jgi:hypothetical protein
VRRVIALCLLTACGTSHSVPDADVAEDAGQAATDAGPLASDAGAQLDAGAAPDAGQLDAGQRDAGTVEERAGWIQCDVERCELAVEGCLASCVRGELYEPSCIPYSEDGTWPGEDCPSGDERYPIYWLRCDGPEDCAGDEVCKLVYGSLGQYAYCIPCDGECDAEREQSLCHDDRDCDADAPSCAPTTALPGYSICALE